ncbi:TPA: MBL fold metallo-hydrolase, partial [Clostridioides difficile]
FFKSSLVSVISYLVDLEEIGYILENGELLYYTKTK